MCFRRCLAFAVMFGLSLSVGCSMTNPTVRGQNPEGGPIIGSAPGYGDLKRTPYIGRHHQNDFKAYSGFNDNDFGYEGGFYSGPERYVTDRNLPYAANGSGECPQCNSGQNCPQDGCRHCGRGCGHGGGFPQHYQTNQIQWPQNMVYPQQGAPTGVVQYPYYTLRGPTDFFMK